MSKTLSNAEINHLRRLVAWIRCEYFCSPEEIVKIVQENSEIIGEPDAEGKARLVEWHQRAAKVPKYVRAAIKSLEKVTRDAEGNIVDAEMDPAEVRALELQIKRLADSP